MTSISFDRAADYYDETRALPAIVQREVVDMLAAELRDRGPVLEIGVGTGRFALPLAEAGIDVFGVDISRPMLARLIEKQRSSSHLVHALIGDATSLPFGNSLFGAAYAVHVLHLISSWADAVLELIRVVRPGGVILFDLGNGPQESALRQLISQRFGRSLHIGLSDPVKLDHLMQEQGATTRPIAPITHRRRMRPSRFVERILENQFSFTWSLSDQERRDLAKDVEQMLRSNFGDLESQQEIESTIEWRAYDLP